MLHVAKWIKQWSFGGPLWYCQSERHKITDDLEIIRSSFIELSVTFPHTTYTYIHIHSIYIYYILVYIYYIFPHTTYSHTTHTEVTQLCRLTGEQCQILYKVVKRTSHLKQYHIQSVSVYLIHCIFCIEILLVTFSVLIYCSTHKISTTDTDFFDTRTK